MLNVGHIYIIYILYIFTSFGLHGLLLSGMSPSELPKTLQVLRSDVFRSEGRREDRLVGVQQLSLHLRNGAVDGGFHSRSPREP